MVCLICSTFIAKTSEGRQYCCTVASGLTFYILFLSLNLNMNIRVRIIALHHANCEVNSSCCDCKVVNYTKIAKQFFSQGKFNSSKLYFSASYPYFIHPLHTIIKRNIAYTQNYTTKWKKCFAIFKKHFRLYQGKNLATLGIFTAK